MNPSNTLNYLKKPFKKFSHLKLTKKSKISDDLPDASVESAEDLSGQPSLAGLKGDLEIAVNQYLSQVKELGYYKETRENNNLKFTTFKAPTLPKKTGKKPVAPKPPTVPNASTTLSSVDDQLLDVKFQLISDATTKEEPGVAQSEESSLESGALDNPLYLSLSECSSGSQREFNEPVYENSAVGHSDEDEHIYENVETVNSHLYDTVTNPPRPKLPPKASNSQNSSRSTNSKIEKTKFLPDGSETSDLGSSGSEDTNSEEDWPLPPSPLTEDNSTSDVPLPPPPPELALQKLEEEVFRIEEEEKRQTLLRKKKKFPLNIKKQEKEKDVILSKENAVESPVDQEVSIKKDPPQEEQFLGILSEEKESSDEFQSIRHSVVIELKDSLPSNASPENESPDPVASIQTQKIVNSVCLNIKQEQPLRPNNIFLNSTSFNDQIIEISDDGSWEMKGTEETDQGASSNHPQEIDRFTGQPIMADIATVEPIETKISFETKQDELHKPEIYFDEPKTHDDSFESCDGVYSASCVETSSIAPESMENFGSVEKDPREFEEVSEVIESKTCNSNLGAAIMEGYEKDLKKKKDNLNLPEVSLLEFGDDVKDLEIQRRSVIDQMTVKAKKKDSWIRTFRSASDPSIDVTVDGKVPISKVTKTSPSKQQNGFLGKTVKFTKNESDQKKTVKKTEEVCVKSSVKPRKNLQEGFLGKCLQTPQKERCLQTQQKERCLQTQQKEERLQSKNNETSQIKETEEEIKDEVKAKGEVDGRSILDKKAQTKSYWESKMLGVAVDDGGWEPVANVRFQVQGITNDEASVPPPPEFSAEDESQYETLACVQDSLEGFVPPQQEKINPRPARQYMYGVTEQTKIQSAPPPVVRGGKKENLIEAEIREQQLKEEALRRQLRHRDKGASSPSSHVSDEGFVDRTPEEPPSPQNEFTHTLSGANGEHIIYDAVSPPSEFFTENSDSETKIAMEIRELKEREAELRAIREMREREQQLRSRLPSSRVDEEEEERSSSSSRETTDDHLTSLTTTTDEGNFSEYGDPTSSEDKSSDGSNSRIMSPDLVPFSSHAESRQRKPVTVKPFVDDQMEEQEPVYTRMKKESVIEREIRLAKEREEAYRREKGLSLVTPSGNKPKAPKVPQEVQVAPVVKPVEEVVPKRGVQHRIATSRIQLEIEETSRREKELQHAGNIKTLSEDTVDSKVTRLADLASEQERQANPPLVSVKSCPNGVLTPQSKMAPPSPISSPYCPPAFTPSPSKRPPAPTRLTRSLSTNNLSIGGPPSNAMRPSQKGLMQKFFASRGKLTGTTFVASNSLSTANKNIKTTANGVPTRPMRVMPKAPVVRREVESKLTANEPPKIYKRTQVTAEEKIQEELRDMKQREEELRRLRARNLARSQPNLCGLGEEDDEDSTFCDGVDSSSFLHEMNGLRSALSNPNLLDDEEPIAQVVSQDKGVRRRSALIAQWEGRIQQTTES